MNAKPKQIICKNKSCRTRFTQFNSIVVWCSPKCGQELAAARVKANYKKETTRLTRNYYDNDRKHQLKLAKDACHAYIRYRDRHLPCIDCGTYQAAQWDAGHYKTRGAFSELQFNEMNIHKQCSQCNKDGFRGMVLYRINLLVRIGESNLDWLESDRSQPKLTLEEIKGITWWYKLKLKNLKEGPLFNEVIAAQQQQSNQLSLAR